MLELKEKLKIQKNVKNTISWKYYLLAQLNIDQFLSYVNYIYSEYKSKSILF